MSCGTATVTATVLENPCHTAVMFAVPGFNVSNHELVGTAITLVLSEVRTKSGCPLIFTFATLEKSANMPARKRAPGPVGDGTATRTACKVPGSVCGWSGPNASSTAASNGDNAP